MLRERGDENLTFAESFTLVRCISTSHEVAVISILESRGWPARRRLTQASWESPSQLASGGCDCVLGGDPPTDTPFEEACVIKYQAHMAVLVDVLCHRRFVP